MHRHSNASKAAWLPTAGLLAAGRRPLGRVDEALLAPLKARPQQLVLALWWGGWEVAEVAGVSARWMWLMGMCNGWCQTNASLMIRLSSSK